MRLPPTLVRKRELPIDVVSLMFWEEGEELKRLESLVEALRGGVKMSRPNASRSIPRIVAAR